MAWVGMGALSLFPLNAPRIHSGHASAQRQGFSLSTVSIDHILHGLRRACSLGQEGKDRVNDTPAVCTRQGWISNQHPSAVCTQSSQNILGLLQVLHGGQDMTTGATGTEHVVYLPPLFPNTSANAAKTTKGSA